MWLIPIRKYEVQVQLKSEASKTWLCIDDLMKRGLQVVYVQLAVQQKARIYYMSYNLYYVKSYITKMVPVHDDLFCYYESAPPA